MNELVTSQPLLIFTGAGASKALGKATTYDIYDSREFLQRASVSPFSVLSELRDVLARKTPKNPVDFEVLLDTMLDDVGKFDRLCENPAFLGPLSMGKGVRDNYAEAYEEALDFMVDYYGRIHSGDAVSLYHPFFDGLRSILAQSDQSPAIIPLFTLNYDEAVETAVQEMPEYELMDGFRLGYRSVWSRDSFDHFHVSSAGTWSVVLFKLHGSVSWTHASGSERIERTVDVPRRREGREHLVLYPTRLAKPINKEPFATAYEYFDAALQHARLAVFIGTSLRDAEIVERIRRRLEQQGPFRLLAISPNANADDIASRLGTSSRAIKAMPGRFDQEAMPEILSTISSELNHL